MEIIVITSKNNPKVFSRVAHAANGIEQSAEVSFEHPFRFINVDEILICGTDGHKLHYANNDIEFKPGFYRVISHNTKKIVLHREMPESTKLTYPDVNHVINKLPAKQWHKFNHGKVEYAIVQAVKIMPDEYIINYSSFAKSFKYAWENFSISQNGNALLMEAEGNHSIIMFAKNT